MSSTSEDEKTRRREDEKTGRTGMNFCPSAPTHTRLAPLRFLRASTTFEHCGECFQHLGGGPCSQKGSCSAASRP